MNNVGLMVPFTMALCFFERQLFKLEYLVDEDTVLVPADVAATGPARNPTL